MVHKIASSLCRGFFGLFILLIPVSETRAQLLISEILASNNRINLDPETGVFTDWVELHNTGADNLILSGYGLSDNPSKPDKWKFPDGTNLPAGGYLLVFTDGLNTGLHASFALSRDGESVVLSDPSGAVLDRLDFGVQKPDISYGRDPLDPLAWLYFGEPTPAGPNLTAGLARPVSAGSVAFSRDAGLYFGSLLIELSVPDALSGDEIRYTSDGSDPGPQSEIYHGPFTLYHTTALRARLYRPGFLPGPIITRTYFIDDYPSLPVVSVTLNPDYLWNDTTGIYVDGIGFNGKRESRNCCREDWERPINIEFFSENGVEQFNELAGIQVKGKMNCEFPKKPFGVFFRSRYGNAFVNYKLFGDKSVTQFSDFYLRPGGADGMGNCYNGTMFRDELLSTMLIGQMDIDYEAARAAVLYVNGQYWGIHFIRERNKSDYLAGNYGIDPDSVDLIENSYNGGVISGDDVAYNELLDLVRKQDVNDPAVWDQVTSRMDVDEFINYQIAEIYINNKDWAANNVLCWRTRTPAGKFRWLFFDVEGGFGLYGNEDYLYNIFSYPEDQVLHHRTLFYRLMQSNWFRAEFLQRFCVYLSTTFNPDRVNGIIDSLKAVVEPEMEADIARWGNTVTTGGAGCRPINSLEEWESHVQIMRAFARRRPEIALAQLQDKYYLNGTYNLDIEADNGIVMINGATAGNRGTYFSDIPVRLKACPAAGYRFVRWEGVDGGDTLSVTFRSDTLIRAVFTLSGEMVLPGEVNQNLILTASGSPYLASGNVLVARGATLSMEPGTVVYMPAGKGIHVYGGIRINGTEDQPVEIRNYPSDGGRWGALVIDQAGDSCQINHLVITAASLDAEDPVTWKANISIKETGVPIDGLSITDCAGNPLFIKGGPVSIRNSTFHSTGVCDLVNVSEASDILIENCIFRGNERSDTDALDLDAVSRAVVRNNLISGFAGPNCDGIDIGYSDEVTLEGNRFEGISDKAVSVGMGSRVTMKGNLVIHCNAGAGIKDQGSCLYSDRNTFYDNATGIHCFEKEPGRGGGEARVVNTVFAGNAQEAGVIDGFSQWSVSYSLSDRSLIAGKNNLTGDPGFRAPALGQFRLRAQSVCIDAGDPETPADPDGTLPDLGCFYHDKDLYDGLAINEIDVSGTIPWLELYNGGGATIDLGGIFFFRDQDLADPVTFKQIDPLAHPLKPGEFLLVQDPERMILPAGQTSLSVGQYLSGACQPVDELVYKTILPGYSFGRYPDGSDLLRHFSEKTPGAPNRILDGRITGLFINEFLALNQNGITTGAGKHEDWIEIYNSNSEPVNLAGLWMTDRFDQLLLSEIPYNQAENTTIPARGYKVFWADNDPLLGPLHLGFKLDGDGEAIALVQCLYPDTLILDSVRFTAQRADISFGRKPDGGPVWEEYPIVTPGRSNITLGTDQQSGEWILKVYPVPASSWLTVQWDNLPVETARMQITGTDGRIWWSGLVGSSTPRHLQIPLEGYPAGVYFIRLVARHSVQTVRFIVE